jgi:hypothetical protein
VYLVDDDVLDGAEFLLELRGVEQDGERLRRGVEDVWRGFEHPLALAAVGVTVTDGMTHFAHLGSALLQFLAYPIERTLQVPVDVVRERLQRGDIQAVDGVLETLLTLASVQLVDNRGK